MRELEEVFLPKSHLSASLIPSYARLGYTKILTVKEISA
jgi:hypothetical protein